MNRFLRGGAVLLSALSLGCAGLPAPWSEADALVLIPVEVRNTSEFGVAREFWARFSDGRPEVEIPTDGSPYWAVVVPGPDLRLVGVRSRIRSDRSFVSGAEALIPVDRELPYHAGEVVVVPWELLVVQRRVNDAESSSGLIVAPVSRETMQAVVEAARRDPGAKAWFSPAD